MEPSPEVTDRQERRFKQHEIALKKILRPDQIEENNSIYARLEAKELSFKEAKLEHEKLLIKVGSQDHMTGLDNAKAAEVKLSDLMEYCQQMGIPLSGIYMDGDGFREINAVLGHNVGDRVIKALAQAVDMGTREETDLQVRLSTEQKTPAQPRENEESGTPSRLGGDEFFVTLPGANLEETIVVFSRISTIFAAITDENIPEYKQRFGKSMTITGGAVQYNPDLDSNPQEFINRNERALQHGKETQKGILTLSRDSGFETIRTVTIDPNTLH